jgi:hypothetical protein
MAAPGRAAAAREAATIARLRAECGKRFGQAWSGRGKPGAHARRRQAGAKQTASYTRRTGLGQGRHASVAMMGGAAIATRVLVTSQRQQPRATRQIHRRAHRLFLAGRRRQVQRAAQAKQIEATIIGAVAIGRRARRGSELAACAARQSG